MKSADDKRSDMHHALDDLAGKFRSADFNGYFIFGSLLLVSAIGIFALFSPSDNHAGIGNPACGKIVVAADGPSLRSNVAPSLTGAQYFLVINPLTTKLLEAVKNPFALTQLPGADVAYFVAGKGEEAVIAGDIDPQCYRVLARFGVRAYGGYTGRVKDVVDLYRQASAMPVPLGKPMIGITQSPDTAAPVGLAEPFFSCPNCRWRVHSPQGMGGYPMCPNCKTIFTPTPSEGPVIQDPLLNGIQNVLGRGPVLAWGQNTKNAPPIYADAAMPHAYRGVCSNCHQIFPGRNPANVGGAQQVAWNNGSIGRNCPVR